MALNFNGLNLLDSNRYDNIMIRGLLTENRQDFQVDVKSLKTDFKGLPFCFKFKGEAVMTKFSEQIRDIDDKEKVIEIVKKYLEYSQISEIKNLSRLPYYKGWFNVIRGTRNLYLQIYGSDTEIIPSLILKKYIDDRLMFLNDNKDVNLYQIDVGYNSTSYEIKKQEDKEYIRLSLFSKDYMISEFEQHFLKDFILDKLYRSGMDARFVYITSINQFTKNINNYGYHIVCGDLVIYFHSIGRDASLLEQIKTYLQEYNESLKQNKMMQLKLEGF